MLQLKPSHNPTYIITRCPSYDNALRTAYCARYGDCCDDFQDHCPILANAAGAADITPAVTEPADTSTQNEPPEGCFFLDMMDTYGDGWNSAMYVGWALAWEMHLLESDAPPTTTDLISKDLTLSNYC